MDELKLQTRYAQSLFDLAQENNITEIIFSDMTYIYNVCKENREMEVVLKNPTIKPLKKKDIMLALFENSCNNLTIKFLSLIASKRRDVYLRGICQSYIDIYNKSKNIKIAKITTANNISEELIKTIKEKFERELDSKVQIELKKDTSLIGGFIVEIDGKQYDASFTRKLNDLKQEIIK